MSTNNSSSPAPSSVPVASASVTPASAPVSIGAAINAATFSAALPFAPSSAPSSPVLDDDLMDITEDESSSPAVAGIGQATNDASIINASSDTHGRMQSISTAIKTLVDECEELTLKLAIELKDASPELKARVHAEYKQKRKDLGLLRDFLVLRSQTYADIEKAMNPAPATPPSGSVTSTLSSVACSSCAGHAHAPAKPVVPNNLPFFQWAGQIFDQNRPVFEDIDSCLLSFEDVLGQYSLDLDKFWLIHIKRCLSGEARVWLDSFVASNSRGNTIPSWSAFKYAYKLEYGPSEGTVKTAAIRQLSHIKMGSSETMRAFVQRFRKLVTKANVQDRTVVLNYFNNGIPDWFLDNLTDSLALAPEFQREDLDFVLGVAKELYEKKSSNGLITGSKRSASAVALAASPELKKSKYAPSSSANVHVNGSTAVSRPPPSAPATASSGGKKTKWCAYHKRSGHNTDNCNALKRKDAEAKASGGLCFKCNTPGSFPGHSCNTAVAPSLLLVLLARIMAL